MDKKNRTGLQSKISHIFAGVPIPRKRKHLFGSSEHKKDEPSALLHPPEDEFVDEETAAEQAEGQPQVKLPVQEEAVTKETSAEESHAEQAQDLQEQSEQKRIEPESREPEEEFSVRAEPDEEFTAVQDSDFQTEAPQHIAEKDKVEHEETAISQSKTRSVEEDASFEKLISPDARTHREPEVTRPATPETKVDKAIINNIPAPPVKVPTVEKPLPEAIQKPQTAESHDSLGMQNLLIGKIPGTEAVKKSDLRISRKISAKPAGKRPISGANVDQSRQKTMLVLAVVLTVVLVLVLSNNFNISSLLGSGGSGIIEQPGSVTSIAKNVGIVKIDWPEPPVYPDGIRDPMSLQKTVSTSQTNDNIQKFVVKGISYVDGRYLVLVDTDLLTVGDEVYGAKITKITDNSVEFERDGNVWTQKVGE
jgi:hypothetical protein